MLGAPEYQFRARFSPAPGDTDLSWTRITPWRAVLASAFDTADAVATSAVVHGDAKDASAVLMAGWLSSCLGFYVPVQHKHGGGIGAVTVSFADGTEFEALRDGARVVLRRDQQADTVNPFPERSLGELLAEELRRLDADQPYAKALGAVSDTSGLNDRAAKRGHIWNDPALAPAAV